MNTRNDSVASLAEHLRANGLVVVWTDAAAVSASHSLNSEVREDVTVDNGRYVTAYEYEVGQCGDERATAHRVASLVGAGSGCEAPPVDVETISATIGRALCLGSGRPDSGVLTELEEELRGHVSLLLAEARKPVRHLWPSSIEAHRLKARLDAIERRTQQGLGQGALSARVQVHQLARDCQYLLARHTAEARR
ncbi:DUF6415 family natural product biosynthesis protein [Streptomyces sioyaensis]|uniref:DUF6415 family natural product biosynthesis protein n=1 Tax=Streptomyces sioyaensis TaxID=67364 RepID=UPI003D75B3AD